MPGGSKKSRFMQRCVADVTGQGKDLRGAFAVCTAQSQKAGYSEPGSTKQTGKGAARERFFKGQKDMGAKGKAYEKAVKAGRKAEDMADMFAMLAEAMQARKQRGTIVLYRTDFRSAEIWLNLLDTFEIPTPTKENGWRECEAVTITAGRVEFEMEKHE